MLNLTPYADRNLILTGYLGPKQPLIVRQIAERLNMPFVSFELRLEQRADRSLDEVRALFGEARLKTMEAEVIDEMVLHRGAVIAISGETLLRGDYLARLSETGKIICLTAALDAVLQRLHLALGARYHTPAERAIALGKLKRERSVQTRETIHLFDTTGMSDDEIIEAVAALWRQEALLLARG
jgi:shikimate kinase